MSWQSADSFPGAGELRAGDADRERVAHILQRAAADGRLDFAELEERLDRVLQAKTYDDLQRVTSDVPLAEFHDDAEPVLPARPESNEITAVFKKAVVAGNWLVPARLVVRCIAGEATLDFTDAVMPNEVTIETYVAMGTLRLTVPEGVAVELDGGGALVSRSVKTPTKPEPGTPIVRVRGPVFLGEVTARPPRRRRWFRWGRRSA